MSAAKGFLITRVHPVSCPIRLVGNRRLSGANQNNIYRIFKPRLVELDARDSCGQPDYLAHLKPGFAITRASMWGVHESASRALR